MRNRRYSYQRVQNKPAIEASKSAAILPTSPRVLDGVTCLYRYYSVIGELLYVGISLSALQRLNEHRDEAAWFPEVTTIKIERFMTRKDARAAERMAIETEHPAYNKQHGKPRLSALRLYANRIRIFEPPTN